MVYEVVYNTTDSPLIADDEGRQIGGHEWGVIDTTASTAEAALDRDDFVKVDVGEDANENALAAKQRAADLTKRAGKFGNISKSKLIETAIDAGLDIDPDDPPHKNDLVAMLAAREKVNVPKRSTASKSSSSDDDSKKE